MDEANVMVGAAVYPEPLLVRLTVAMEPLDVVPMFATAVAPLPPPPERVTEGAEVNPEPALVRFTPITLLPFGNEQLL